MNTLKNKELVVFANDQKTIKALKIKMPEFKDAKEQLGFPGARETIKDATVLTEYIPLDMVAITDTVLLMKGGLNKATKEHTAITPDIIAESMEYVQIFTGTNQIAWKTFSEASETPKA